MHQPGVIPTREHLEKYGSAEIKWAAQDELVKDIYTAKDRRETFTDDIGYPFYDTDHGRIEKPGMLPAAVGSTFLAERTYKSVFHQLTDFQTVTSWDNKIVFMDADGRLQGLRALQDGKQRTRADITPDKVRTKEKVLHAEPYVETAEFTQTMLWDNLEQNRFLQSYMEAIGRKRNWNMGILELYAKRDTTQNSTDGIHVNDGLFVQLDEAYNFYKENVEDVDSALYGQGYYCGVHGTGTDKIPLDFTKTDREEKGNIIEQLADMETQYFTQQGLVGHQFLVSYEAYGQLKKIASQRETVRGDSLFFEGTDLILNGTQITPCMELGLPENGYNQHVLLGNFQSGVMTGMREDFNTKLFYDDNEFKWKANTFVYFGVLLKYEQDVLAAEVTGLPTQVAGSSASSGDNTSTNP